MPAAQKTLTKEGPYSIFGNLGARKKKLLDLIKKIGKIFRKTAPSLKISAHATDHDANTLIENTSLSENKVKSIIILRSGVTYRKKR